MECRRRSSWLHHQGRKTGQERVVPVAYLAVKDGWAVFGFRAGSKWHPDWYLNLFAHPDTTVETADGLVRVRAREATGAKRDRILERRAADRSGRSTKAGDGGVIPVLVLERHG